jgi:hypothetical protein
MVDVVAGTVDQALERRRVARRLEWRALCEQEARIAQRKTQLVREADDERDWEAAGCTSRQPVFTDEAGRTITAYQPHAPPG